MRIPRFVQGQRLVTTGLMMAALGFSLAVTPVTAAEKTAEKTDKQTQQEEAPAPQTTAHICHRTTLTEAVSLARAAIAKKHAPPKDAQTGTDNENSAEPPHVVDVLTAELAITAVPRYYELILFDDERNYLVHIDEATNQVLNLTRPGEGRDEQISREARVLYDTAHVRLEEIIAGAQEARPRGIPTAARLNAIYGAQPVYEVVMRMPPGNDEVLLVDGLSGNAIKMENFQ